MASGHLAMPPMIKELYTHKELEFIAMESFAGLRMTFMTRHWNSEEELIAYAKSHNHLIVWKNSNKKASKITQPVFTMRRTS